MPRKLRIDVEGAWHHVMNRGADRRRTFFSRADGLEFERLLGSGHERFGVEIHAYCLMPNHFHLLVNCPHGGLGAFMQHVTGSYTRFVNDRLGRDGALFRGRYHALLVRDERYILAATRYIHRNPIDTVNDDPRWYRWSSHAIYLGERQQPDWFVTSRLLDMFDGGAAAFDDAVFGDEGAGPPRHAQLLDQIALIASEIDSPDAARGPRFHRTVAQAMLDDVTGDVRDRLARELDLDGHHARRAAQRARRRLANDDSLVDLSRAIARRVA